MCEENLVFVYGTLKRGFSNNRYLAGSKFLGTARTKEKFALYSDGLPFLIMTESISEIHGELYQVDDLTLQILDDLEGHPDWYRREQVEICLDDGNHSVMKAWVYFTLGTGGGKLIPSGIYTSNRF